MAPKSPIASASPSAPSAAATAGGGIVYTCDATINALSATVCNTLNTTIAGLYSSAFTNANASIYITLGNPGVFGNSNWSFNWFNYSDFRNALIDTATDANDAAAIASSVPEVNPYGSSSVGIVSALQRALGLSTTPCVATAGCYDGTITMGNSSQYYFRTGSISGNQYDFFTLVEHETDEILGTPSCALGCGYSGTVFPPDYFRYHSDGTRSFAAGTNDPCSASDSTNACFSLDGVNMMQQYNNINGGGDAGDWVTNCGRPHVQDVAICSGTAGVDISPSAEILVLDAVGYTVRSSGLLFVSMAPCRVVDTRDVAKPSGFGPPSISGGTAIAYAIPNGPCGVPAAAQAYSLNVTVVPHGDLGYLTVWPTGQSQPVVSTLNSLDGEVKANAAIVPAGTGGAISVFATDDTDVVLDINGYFVPPNTVANELAFYPMTPCRLVDTRPGAPSSIITGALTGGTSNTLPILSSSCNVPATAQAYSLNFTLVPPGPVNYLTVYPTGEGLPVVSTLNDPTGTVEANAAIALAGSGGNIDVYVTDMTDLVVDINGYFAPVGEGALSLYPLPPCRVLDTRNPAGALPLAGAINVNVIGSGCGGTYASQAYVFNATVVPDGPLGYLTLWPQGSMQPLVSTLNAYDGNIASNLAIVPSGNTEISAFATNNTYLILDISGYFAP
jgi:hypothetical protein